MSDCLTVQNSKCQADSMSEDAASVVDPNTCLARSIAWICTTGGLLSSSSAVIDNHGVFYEKFPLLSLSKGNVPIMTHLKAKF